MEDRKEIMGDYNTDRKLERVGDSEPEKLPEEQENALFARFLEKHELSGEREVAEIGYRSKRGILTSMDRKFLRKIHRDLTETKKWAPIRKKWFEVSDRGRERAMGEVNPLIANFQTHGSPVGKHLWENPSLGLPRMQGPVTEREFRQHWDEMRRLEIGERIREGDWWYYRAISTWMKIEIPPRNLLGLRRKITGEHAPFYRLATTGEEK